MSEYETRTHASPSRNNPSESHLVLEEETGVGVWVGGGGCMGGDEEKRSGLAGQGQADEPVVCLIAFAKSKILSRFGEMR